MAWSLNSCDQAPRAARRFKKGKQMSVHSSLQRTFVAIAAAIVMSTVAVGAAVGPAQAANGPSAIVANA